MPFLRISRPERIVSARKTPPCPRSSVDVLRAIQQSALYRHARFYAHLLKKATPHPNLMQLWHMRFNAALTIVDDHLQRNRWFVADRFTIADIALYAYTHAAPQGGLDL